MALPHKAMASKPISLALHSRLMVTLSKVGFFGSCFIVLWGHQQIPRSRAYCTSNSFQALIIIQYKTSGKNLARQISTVSKLSILFVHEKSIPESKNPILPIWYSPALRPTSNAGPVGGGSYAPPTQTASVPPQPAFQPTKAPQPQTYGQAGYDSQPGYYQHPAPTPSYNQPQQVGYSVPCLRSCCKSID